MSNFGNDNQIYINIHDWAYVGKQTPVDHDGESEDGSDIGPN
jgi:hypothetical protein